MRNVRQASRWVVLVSLVGLLGSAPRAQAALRSPQVAVSGTALQTFFTSQLQAIGVVGSQLDLQRTSVPLGASIQVHVFAGAANANVGIYNASAASPPLYLMLTASAGPGWFSVASFRATPDRLIVNLFDNLSSFVGTNTYLGADRTDFGFYAQDLGGTFYSQDARNPSAAPRILAYAGTGARTGSTWFVCETGAGPGGDFADVIMLVDLGTPPVPTRSTSWSRVKTLYHTASSESARDR